MSIFLLEGGRKRLVLNMEIGYLDYNYLIRFCVYYKKKKNAHKIWKKSFDFPSESSGQDVIEKLGKHFQDGHKSIAPFIDRAMHRMKTPLGVKA